MAYVVVGTAGHIDHGKSTLVRALTGTDPDRLPEEKRRGITTDLGYAFLDDLAAIIDVPGHERLVHNMVAGAATIDFGLLVVAADDGVMPQTVEHLHILQLLGVRSGAVVLTKCDGPEENWIDLVEEQVRDATQGTFLEAAPVYRVDSVSGKGLNEFRSALLQHLRACSPRATSGVFRLPIDRVFTMKGRGTVITGTILAGHVQENARLVALPGGLVVRAKQMETHGRSASELRAGQRAALNLVVDTDKLVRGMTLTTEGSLLETRRVLVRVERLPHAPPLLNRQRVRLLIGTQEVIGRVLVLAEDGLTGVIAHVLLEESIVACWHDRFVLRRYSPVETLGGGIVLEPVAPRQRSKDAVREIEFSRKLLAPDMRAAILAFAEFRGDAGVEETWLAACFGLSEAELLAVIESDLQISISRLSNRLLTTGRLAELRRQTELIISELHRAMPENSGFQLSEIGARLKPHVPDAILNHVIKELESAGKVARDQALVRLAGQGMTFTKAQTDLHGRVLSVLLKGGFAPPPAQTIADEIGAARGDIERALVLMERTGICKRLSVDLFFESRQFEHAVSQVKQFLSERGTMTVSDATNLLKSSRKYVVPFLEHLDSQGITMRHGNLRKRGAKF